MSAKNLSKGEKRVIDGYNGNASETAKKLGMSAGYVEKLLRKDYVLAGIRNRDEKEKTKEVVANRQERQEFWTSVLRGEPQLVKVVEKTDDKGKAVLGADGQPVMVNIMAIPSMKDRARASELLGRSSADFVDRLHVSEERGVPQEITDDMEPKKATNTYLDLVKARPAGSA